MTCIASPVDNRVGSDGRRTFELEDMILTGSLFRWVWTSGTSKKAGAPIDQAALVGGGRVKSSPEIGVRGFAQFFAVGSHWWQSLANVSISIRRLCFGCCDKRREFRMRQSPIACSAGPVGKLGCRRLHRQSVVELQPSGE